VLGGFSSAVFIYGVALTTARAGTTNLTQIADFLSHNVIASNGVLLAGLSLLLVGFLFQGRRRPVPHVDPRRLPGARVAGHRFMEGVAKPRVGVALLRAIVLVRSRRAMRISTPCRRDQAALRSRRRLVSVREAGPEYSLDQPRRVRAPGVARPPPRV